MVNWVKRVQNFSGNNLEPDEQVQAVLLTQPIGQTTGSLFGLAGMLINKSSESADKNTYNVTESELSRTFPIRAAYLVKTNKRIIVYSQGSFSGKPKEYLGDYRNNEITGIEYKKGTISSRIFVRYSDGGTAMAECPKGVDVETFANAMRA